MRAKAIRVVQSDQAKTLEKAVNKYLSQGWELWGQLVWTGSVFYQAVIDPAPPKQGKQRVWVHEKDGVPGHWEWLVPPPGTNVVEEPGRAA